MTKKAPVTPTSTSTKLTESKQPEQPSMLTPSVTFTLTFAWKEVQPEYDKQMNQLAKRVKLDGFRQGKVPAKLAKQTVGQEGVAQRVLQTIVPAVFQQHLKDHPVDYVGSPEFNATVTDENTDWVVQVALAPRPVIEIKNYQNYIKKTKRDWEKEQQTEEVKKLKPEEQEQRQLSRYYSALMAGIKPAMPELLVKQEVKDRLHELSHQLERLNMTFEDFLKARNLPEAQVIQELTMEALAKLQVSFLTQALITVEKLLPDEKELDTEITKLSEADQDYLKKEPQAKMVVATRIAQKRLDELLLKL